MTADRFENKVSRLTKERQRRAGSPTKALVTLKGETGPSQSISWTGRRGPGLPCWFQIPHWRSPRFFVSMPSTESTGSQKIW